MFSSFLGISVLPGCMVVDLFI